MPTTSTPTTTAVTSGATSTTAVATTENRLFSSLGHVCEMPAEDDEIEKRFPKNDFSDRVKKFWIKFILVHEKICKLCAVHLRSHGAIENEKQRHIWYYPSSIHPYSIGRLWCDIFMTVVSFMQLILVPLDVGFFPFKSTVPYLRSTGFLVIRMTLDLFCCMEIGVNSISGYYDESKKEVILHHKEILKHYLKTTFFIDFITSVPTHWDLFFHITLEDSRYLIITLQGISLLKYIRFFTFIKLARKLCTIFSVTFYVRHGSLMILTLIVFWHVISCTQIFAYYLMGVNIDVYSNSTPFKAVMRGLYHGAIVVSTASYGVEDPKTKSEYILVTFLWFLSKYVQIYLLTRVIEFLRAKTAPKMKYSQMLRQIVEFMRHKQLPLYTQDRILSYYEFHFQKSYFRETEIYMTVSGQMRQEIVMQTCSRLVENVEFFRDLPMNLLIQIVTCLHPEIYLTNDTIVKADALGNCMFFIASGTVAVYTASGKEVCHLEDGDHFGEVALVGAEGIRAASVIAVEICQLYRLDRKDFVKIIYPYPDLFDKIHKVALWRMEKTKLIEEHYKRDEGHTTY